MKWIAIVALSMLLAGSIVFAETAGPATQPADGKRTTSSGLQIIETGHEDIVAAAGDTVWVKYLGKLENGTKFDASDDHAETRNGISFPLGAGQVIKGWDEGIAGMKLGDKRTLIIPPNLGYGGKAQGPIPANSTLVFDVQLVGIRHGQGR